MKTKKKYRPMVPFVFSLTLCLSAALLFWVQLFASKMILPVLGGSAAVWNTAMMFFQISLLLGYLYAHLSSSPSIIRTLDPNKSTIKWKVAIHPLLLILASVVLPISLKGVVLPGADVNPVWWLIEALLFMLGAPFLILAGTAPIIQAWFSRTGHSSSHDPYFLYAASNFGSLLALLTYPTLIEPHFTLVEQSHLWAFGYCLLILSVAICGLIVVYVNRSGQHISQHRDTSKKDDAPLLILKFRWVVLALVPSSLLLGVTTHLTVDVAATPLLWVIPLILYLLSFVLAFQRALPISQTFISWLQAFLLLSLAMLFLTDYTDNILIKFSLNLVTFFVTAFLCHQELALLRPSTRYLTDFYLYLALGGALGGIFNGLLSPLIFQTVLEYPLMLIMAALLRPGLYPSFREWPALILDITLPLLVLMALKFSGHIPHLDTQNLESNFTLAFYSIVALFVIIGLHRPVRFGLGIGAIMVIALFGIGDSKIMLESRNFYGILRVEQEQDPPLHNLYNGTTLHGSQAVNLDHRLVPLSYYHHKGPFGHLIADYKGTNLTKRVALVGLGAGTLACYETPSENWTFYEINPEDVKIAKNTDYFTYLRDCPAIPDIVIGDARLSLNHEDDNVFSMIVLDAFSSDAIPIHLITREAVQMYLRKLRPDGLLVFHISNRNLDLAPVLGNLALDLKLRAKRFEDDEDDEDDVYGKIASDWVVMARHSEDLARLKNDNNWKLLKTTDERVWTDDYSNLLSVLIY